MSVFTSISEDELRCWLANYSAGALTSFRGIASGIDNTNYYVNTDQGRYVLTIFEKLKVHQLGYYLDLMSHLSARGLPVPNPIANLDGRFLGEIKNKPAAIVTCLEGVPIMSPKKSHCKAVGSVLGGIHQSGLSYQKTLRNPMGKTWWKGVAPSLYPFLNSETKTLLKKEIDSHNDMANLNLPLGVIHGDLFRDNVLFNKGRVGGVIDFYFACNDFLVYDLAITVNDWCRDDSNHKLNKKLAGGLISSYQEIRSLTSEEADAWPLMLRVAALRFWMSRLRDFYLPRPGYLTHAHPPLAFQRLLEHYIAHPKNYSDLIS